MHNSTKENVFGFFSFSLGIKSAFDLKGDSYSGLLSRILDIDDHDALMNDWKKVGDNIYFAMEAFDNDESKQALNNKEDKNKA